MIVFISYTVSQLNEIGPIHRRKLRSNPKLGHLTERHASAYLHGHRYKTDSIDDHFDICPKHLVWWGCANRTRSGRVPEQVWTRHSPQRVRSIFAGVNATRTSGTGPERGRNGAGTRTGTGVNTALDSATSNTRFLCVWCITPPPSSPSSLHIYVYVHPFWCRVAQRSNVEFAIEIRDPGFESHLLPFQSLSIFVLSMRPSSLICINGYLAVVEMWVNSLCA